MNSRIGILLCGVMTVTLAVAAPVSNPQAAMSTTKRWGDRTPAVRPGVRSLIPQPQETFSVAANYSGFLSTDLLIEGVMYRPDPAMFVYAVGQGLIPIGSSVANQSILVSGVKQGGQYITQMIIVSPRVTTPDGTDMSSFIKVAPADAKP